MEKSGCLEIRGLWVHSAGSGRTFNVISIKQRYFGHSRQAGILASQIPPNGYIGRFVVVVDEDIDPSNLNEVIWAMGSRLDPLTSSDAYYNSRAVLNACIPYERIKDFPPVAQSSPKLRKDLFDRYPDLLKELLSSD